MKKIRHDVNWFAKVSMLSVIVILLAITPLGMIPLPIIKATTTQIPVILGAILLGPLAGVILGGVFGFCSIIINTMNPALLSFAFSPFYSTNIIGALKTIWIAVNCRIMIGLVSGWLWILLKNFNLNDLIALPIVGAIGSMMNTVSVMGSIYFLLRPEYIKTMKTDANSVFNLVIYIIGTNGIFEAIVTLILVSAIGKVLLNLNQKR